jgi:hypothetical protein
MDHSHEDISASLHAPIGSLPMTPQSMSKPGRKMIGTSFENDSRSLSAGPSSGAPRKRQRAPPKHEAIELADSSADDSAAVSSKKRRIASGNASDLLPVLPLASSSGGRANYTMGKPGSEHNGMLDLLLDAGTEGSQLTSGKGLRDRAFPEIHAKDYAYQPRPSRLIVCLTVPRRKTLLMVHLRRQIQHHPPQGPSLRQMLPQRFLRYRPPFSARWPGVRQSAPTRSLPMLSV